jgi:uncharacterized iron-regulated protein
VQKGFTRRFLIALPVACATAALLHAQAAYVPERVFDSARGQFTDFEAMLAGAANADVLFVGEQHDDPNTHRLELAVLQGLARRRGDLIVAMEMFERDVQDPLDHFSMGHMDEAEFLKASRPWPQYATDYKPLVDFAIAHDWPVIASDVPRQIASEVSKIGLDALKAKSADEKQWFAADLQCPTSGEYFTRFTQAMGDHPAGGASGGDTVATARLTLERFYFAQCLKDETMGESIARAWTTGSIGGSHPLVVHFNGAFHSDFGLGTAERASRRLPGKHVVVISMLPVDDLDKIAPDAVERKRADYLVFTTKDR